MLLLYQQDIAAIPALSLRDTVLTVKHETCFTVKHGGGSIIFFFFLGRWVKLNSRESYHAEC